MIAGGGKAVSVPAVNAECLLQRAQRQTVRLQLDSHVVFFGLYCGSTVWPASHCNPQTIPCCYSIAWTALVVLAIVVFCVISILLILQTCLKNMVIDWREAEGGRPNHHHVSSVRKLSGVSRRCLLSRRHLKHTVAPKGSELVNLLHVKLCIKLKYDGPRHVIMLRSRSINVPPLNHRRKLFKRLCIGLPRYLPLKFPLGAPHHCTQVHWTFLWLFVCCWTVVPGKSLCMLKEMCKL